jgi:hypothetical protein
VSERIVEAPRDVHDLFTGTCLARKGDAQRVLDVSGFELAEPYILVTTGFRHGPADFGNTDLQMLSAFAADGSPIPGEIASGTTIWFRDLVDFREWGLSFDTGYNGGSMRLDEPNDSGNRGFVAFARGRNQYLPGALCETEPRVQQFWLRCVHDMLDAGVDGVDVREENHSTHTNHPADFGFNPVVLEAARARGDECAATIAAVRGDAYASVLARAKQAINARGKRMRINFQLDWYRREPAANRRLAYPGNLDFQWRRWIEEGLTDEALLRFYALPFDCVFDDPVAQEVTERCTEKGIPVSVNRYIQPESLAEEVVRVRSDGRFAGFVLYETARFLRPDPDGTCEVTEPAVRGLVASARTPADP